jgi:hypothetical protein
MFNSYRSCKVYDLKIAHRDVMGDISFSGGFETMAAGKDTEGWAEIVRFYARIINPLHIVFVATNRSRLRQRSVRNDILLYLCSNGAP